MDRGFLRSLFRIFLVGGISILLAGCGGGGAGSSSTSSSGIASIEGQVVIDSGIAQSSPGQWMRVLAVRWLTSTEAFAQQMCGIYTSGTVPCTGCQVQMMQGGVQIAGATLPSTGQFSFSNMNSGTYQMRVTDRGGFQYENNVPIPQGDTTKVFARIHMEGQNRMMEMEQTRMHDPGFMSCGQSDGHHMMGT